MYAWIGYALCCYLAADFIAGVFHWWEDRYAKEEWPWIGKWVAAPNRLHHSQPQAFLDQSYWSRNWTTIVPAFIALALTFPHPICLVFVFVSQANEIHAWAHNKGKLSPWIETLQSVGLLQSPKHHAGHHTAPFEIRYCVMSDWLNPILDRMHFWSHLEQLVFRLTGVKTN